ncbi:uncharacterized protein LOC141617761 [Silene latifolia]|uniref:uncharacterized protein LOC141617761 n=1 Tax=Silene latifolia TaxID=37657 RepID=UPI003D7737B7
MAAISTTLLGPPQINVPPLSAAAAAAVDDVIDKNTSDSSSSSSYGYDYDSYLSYSPYTATRGLTETNSKTYLNSGNPCVDFFFHVVPDTPPSELNRLLELSWNKDPLITLKLVCNLRGVRGTGKSDKEGFYTAALWLYEHHPRTLSLNMKSISGFGYFKDMPEILFRVLEGSEVRKISKRQRDESLLAKGIMPRNRSPFSGLGAAYRGIFSGGGGGGGGGRGYNSDSDYDDRDEEKEEEKAKKVDEKKEKTEEEKEKDRIRKEKARVLRLKRKNERTKKVLDKYNQDSTFRLLHDSISDHFGELLRNDVDLLNKGDMYKIGFSAKWCPTIDSTYDEVTLLCESIARRVFPKGEFEEYKDMEEAHYAYHIRDRLRKEVLVPLRKALELPEVYLCAKMWNALPYNRVPSVAMRAYKTLFYKHDKERFEEYLEKVKAGKATIAAGALLPHEIIGQLHDPEGGQVAELQWKRMVDDMAKKGKLNNCMAVCDVSGSMHGIPMEVCVSLGLLISELSEEPWKGKLITFSQSPQFHTITGKTLLKKTEFIRRMDWGMNTDLQKVFDRILEVAIKAKIPEEQMVRRLFVFSDMEFDEASTNTNWESDYMVIQRKFKAAGFENVPEIVFWNLRHSRSTPVPSNQPGVALVSGYSKNLMTLFLEGGGVINPEAVMLEAIGKPEYDALVVYD